MKTISALLVLVFASVYCGGCGIMSKKYTKSKTDTYSISAAGKKKFKLDNVTGSVTISHSADSGIIKVKASKEVRVKKKELDKPFDEITIRLDTTGSMISVNSDFDKKEDFGIFRFDMGKGPRVDYDISIPYGIELEIDNVNGNISCGSLSNDLKIDLVNGDVSLDNYTGLLECEITNGDFSAHVDSTRGMNLSTVNGSISLFLNNFMNANLRAETVNGRITEDNLQLTDIIKEKKMLKAKIGKGTPDVDIKIETVNGKIRLFGKNEI